MDFEENNQEITHIVELIKQIDSLTANTSEFLREIISFLKWTTALSIVIIGWFGIIPRSNSSWGFILGVAGLIFVGLSFCVSIIVIREILLYWEINWKARKPLNQLLICLTGDVEKNPLKKNIQDITSLCLIESSPHAKKYTDWMENFNPRFWITLHLTFLILGIFCYALSILIK
jgi:hypothetical protein